MKPPVPHCRYAGTMQCGGATHRMAGEFFEDGCARDATDATGCERVHCPLKQEYLESTETQPPKPAPSPATANASWFCALKGKVTRQTVRSGLAVRSMKEDPGRKDVFYAEIDHELYLGDQLPAPEGAKEGDRFWVAQSASAPDVWGIAAASPAEAIADFNRAMVTP